MPETQFDVIVVGAGLSGIGAAYHLQRHCPDLRYAVLEARAVIGGTWDLFRYPGIRSDSDMYTLGYAFRPWRQPRTIADGAAILQYVRETAAHYGIDRHIRFRERVVAAAWDSEAARWTIEVACGDDRARRRYQCRFVYFCSGYYDYAQGYAPAFPCAADFQGPVIHPQHWPAELDYTGKRVVVIGSGATAVTLVPALATRAAHVTMLQRSPSYVVSLPAEDGLTARLHGVLPERSVYRLARWKNVLMSIAFFQLCRRAPDFARRLLRKGVVAALGPRYDVDTHFNPRYKPWDQRLCFVPDGDLFDAIRDGRASVVTDHIDRFFTNGIRLRSGRELAADIIVTATGLKLKALGGVELRVDGRPVVFRETLSYKGMMISGVPNLAFALGYTNASWTLRADLTSMYVCRLLRYMARRGYVACTPQRNDPRVVEQPLIDFSSGYVLRAIDDFPRQGSRMPWRVHQNYLMDLVSLRFGSVRDAAMRYRRAAA